ncbi:unnamed protein product [Closterium sp. NIES-53]
MVVLWATTDLMEGSAKATVTRVCNGVRSVLSRKKQLAIPESRGPVVEVAAGSAATAAAATGDAAMAATVATAASAATAIAATAAAAATGAAAIAAVATAAASAVATSTWHASTWGVGASRGGITSGRTA